MGSGKTHWGRIWATENGIPFYDLDTMIEEQEEKTVAGIFESAGEEYFREKETEVLKKFVKKNKFIMACGGGTPCFNDNMNYMNAMGTTIYLTASVQYIYENVIAEKDKRPLIKDFSPAGLFYFIEQTLKEREPFYMQSKIILPVTGLSAESLLTLNV